MKRAKLIAAAVAVAVPAYVVGAGVPDAAIEVLPLEWQIRIDLFRMPDTEFKRTMTRCLDLQYEWNQNGCLADALKRYNAGELR